MNYILTKACNKGCPYCFARESRMEDPSSYMSFEEFVTSVEKIKASESDTSIQLLGGEPTLHPDFLKIIDYLADNHYTFTLISNFLFNDKILNKLLEALEKTNIKFLANGTDLDIKNRMDIWSKNFNAINNKSIQLYGLFRKENSAAVGITFCQEKSVDYYKNYLEFLKKNIDQFLYLRISLDYPGSEERKNIYKYINDKESGDKILLALTFCMNNRIEPNLDCIFYPCLFRSIEDYNFIIKFLIPLAHSNEIMAFNCCGLPLDRGPNNEVWACYPLKNYVKVDDVSKFYNTRDLELELISQKKRYERNIINDLPEICKTCYSYNDGTCSGPAVCLYDLSKYK